LERHPYLPEIERVVDNLRTPTPPAPAPSEAVDGSQEQADLVEAAAKFDELGAEPRQIAIEIVDGIRGYTIEFDNHGDHAYWYDRVEALAAKAARASQEQARPQADLVGLLLEASGYVRGNHDEGCELDPEYGQGNFEGNDGEDETERLWPDDAVCTCGTDELVDKIDAALAAEQGVG